ncbi:MAG: sigma-54 dependent transcriptional regulator [bacterium]
MNILIVDDDSDFRYYLAAILKDVFSHSVIQTGGFHEAMRLEKTVLSGFDLAFIDMKMPMVDGFQAGLQLKRQFPGLVTVMLTAYPSVSQVIKALRDHLFDDFLVKEEMEDVETFTQLKNALHRAENLAAARKALSDEYQLSSVLRTQYTTVHSEFVGQSDSFAQIRELIEIVAPARTTILITGETGTGKELVAREIHRRSLRSLKPFIPINCSAIPLGLLESELFGHKKGSFTGAVGDRAGYFRLAEGGTLFLDEIGDMPLELQAKLLRVLEERQFFPVGSSKLTDAVHLDVRIISATHQDLKQKTDAGTFRQDLLYRLNTMVLNILPLRERSDDIEPLVTYFLSRQSDSQDIKGIQPEALTLLEQWPWPGNVRELKNMIERAVLLSRGNMLEIADFPAEVQGHGAPGPLSPVTAVRLTAPPARNERRAVEVNNSGTAVSVPEMVVTLWETFRTHGHKLWTFDNAESVTREMLRVMQGARYVKKGHSGRLAVPGEITLDVDIHYLSAISGNLEGVTVRFAFQSEKSLGQKPKKTPRYPETRPQVIVQPVLKGLPDTYLFNLLYPPTRKSDLTVFSPQRVIRALLLRFLLDRAPAGTLKSIFAQTMTFLTDRDTATLVEGLSTWGLEAMRAYLCGADHIFAGVARKLRNDPGQIIEEIRTFFPDYRRLSG